MKKVGKKEQLFRKGIKHPHFIDTKLKKLIQMEAKTLDVTPKEYVRLAVGIAKNIREGFCNGEEKDARQLLAMIQNPIFVILLRTVADSFLNQTDSDPGNRDTHVTPQRHSQPQPRMPQQRGENQEIWGYW